MNADAAGRVVQGVLSGVGFIGAGALLHGGGDTQVHGLATAASIWVSAAMGAAAALAVWPLLVGGAVLALFVLLVGAPIERRIRDSARASPPSRTDARWRSGHDRRKGMIDEAALIHLVTHVVEVVGTAIIVVGSFGALASFLVQIARATAARDVLVSRFRSSLGQSILLGLEFLVAADIINTVAVEPTIRSLIVLAGIVLIRTFLSFSLEVEIEGRWPWQRSRGRDFKRSSDQPN